MLPVRGDAEGVALALGEGVRLTVVTGVLARPLVEEEEEGEADGREGEDDAEGIMGVGEDAAVTLLAISSAVEELAATLLADIWAKGEGSLTAVPDKVTSPELTSGCDKESEFDCAIVSRVHWRESRKYARHT